MARGGGPAAEAAKLICTAAYAVFIVLGACAFATGAVYYSSIAAASSFVALLLVFIGLGMVVVGAAAIYGMKQVLH